jgi:gamma-glutamyltranspeptidase
VETGQIWGEEIKRDIRDIVSPAVVAKQSAERGFPIDASHARTKGVAFRNVGRLNEPKAYVIHEDKEMSPSIRWHEGIHWLVEKIAQENEPRSTHRGAMSHRIYAHLNSAIGPHAKDVIDRYLQATQYPNPHAEYVTHLHDLLSSGMKRRFVRAVLGINNHEEWKKIMTDAKQSWKNVTEKAKNLQYEDLFRDV